MSNLGNKTHALETDTNTNKDKILNLNLYTNIKNQLKLES